MLKLIGKYKTAEWVDVGFVLAQDEYGRYFYQMDNTPGFWAPIEDEYVTPHSWVCLEEYVPTEGMPTAVDKVCQKIKQMEKRQNERKQAMSKLSSEGKGQEGGSPVSNAGQEDVVLSEMRAYGEGTTIIRHPLNGIRTIIDHDFRTNRSTIRLINS